MTSCISLPVKPSEELFRSVALEHYIRNDVKPSVFYPREGHPDKDGTPEGVSTDRNHDRTENECVICLRSKAGFNDHPAIVQINAGVCLHKEITLRHKMHQSKNQYHVDFKYKSYDKGFLLALCHEFRKEIGHVYKRTDLM